MRGIFRIKNKKSGKIWGLYIAEDINNLQQEFERVTSEYKAYKRCKVLSLLEPELVWSGEDAEKELASYRFPQISRVSYNDKCYDYVNNKRVAKRIEKALDWLVGTFDGNAYHFLLSINEDDQVDAAVYRNEVLYEEYSFNNSGTPKTRIII